MELKDIIDAYLQERLVDERLTTCNLSSLAADIEYTLYTRLGYDWESAEEQESC